VLTEPLSRRARVNAVDEYPEPAQYPAELDLDTELVQVDHPEHAKLGMRQGTYLTGYVGS